MPAATIRFGVSLVCLQAILFVCTMSWIIRYRKHPVVKKSQPIFSVILATGCFMQVCGILPMAMQGEYRVLWDKHTFRLTEEVNPDIAILDIACMSSPWVYFLGFSFTISALFAKIFQLKKMYEDSLEFRRVRIRARYMCLTVAISVSCMTILLLIMQLVAPLRWQRQISLADANDFTLSSTGQCAPEHSWGWFLILPPYILQTGSLCYVLYLWYVMRNLREVPDEYRDTKWIAISIASIIQINILAIPLLVVRNQCNGCFLGLYHSFKLILTKILTFQFS